MDFKKTSFIPHVAIVVDENNIEKGALEIVRFIKPEWKEDSIKFKLLTDGLTNNLVGCKPEGVDDAETVLVRVYGHKTDLLIDRTAETRNMILLNEEGLVPSLYATFENGLAYGYVPGVALNIDLVFDPNIYRLVARRMAILHKVTVKGQTNPKPLIWDKLRQFLDLVPDVFSNEQIHKSYIDSIAHKNRIENELAELRSKLEKLDSPVVFAHNDLLLGNIIYTESKNAVTFIDYEYAGYNYQAFDIGNHFVEYAGIVEPDYSKLPPRDLQMDWLRTYLAEYHGVEPKEADVKKLYIQVNHFSLLSHLLWGVWSLIQAEHSYIDYDFIGFAAARFGEYFNKKEKLLSIGCSS